MCRTVLSSMGERGDAARMGDDESGDGTAGLKSHEVRSVKIGTGPETENMFSDVRISGFSSSGMKLAIIAR